MKHAEESRANHFIGFELLKKYNLVGDLVCPLCGATEIWCMADASVDFRIGRLVRERDNVFLEAIACLPNMDDTPSALIYTLMCKSCGRKLSIIESSLTLVSRID